MLRRRAFPFVVFFFLTLLLGTAALAQQTGEISGRVTTADGQPLPGVTVEARSPALPQPRVTTTGTNGDYRLPALQPGTYTVQFTLEGMQSSSRTVNVLLGQDSPVSVTMAMSGVAETITVTAESPMLDPTSTAIKSAIDERVIEQIPVGQEYQDLLKLAPAVQYTENQNRGPASGGSEQDNVYFFDGVNVTLPMFGVMAAEPSAHDIAQLSFVKGGAKAVDFNRAAGFTVDSVSKSGTSEWTGEVKYQIQNADFTADQDFDVVSIYDQDRTWATFGIGGPVLQEKLYVYGSYYRPETTRENRANVYGDVPDYESTRDEYFGKVTFTPTSNILLNVSYRDSDREDVNASIGGFEAPTAALGSQTTQTIGILEGSWVINNRSYATLKYTDFSLEGNDNPAVVLGVSPSTSVGARLDLNNLQQMGYVNIPVPISGQTAFNEFIAPIIDRYGYLRDGVRTGGSAVGGYFQINDQDYYRESGQLGYDFTFGETLAHNLHVGYQTYTDEEDLARYSNGWGIIDVIGGRSTFDPDGSGPAAAQPAFFRAEFQRQLAGTQVIHSEFKSENIELNDTMQWGNWAFNVGVMLSKDTMYGQGLKEDPSTISGYVSAPGNKYKMHEIDFADQIQPRLGATWAYNGRDTLYASYAKYNPAGNSLPRAASWDRNTTGLTYRAYFDAEGNMFGIEQRASSSGKFFDDDLDPRYTDEFMVGTSREVSDRLTARLYTRYRYSTNFWEDTNNNARVNFQPPEGIPRELYIPNLAEMIKQIGSGSSYVIAELDGAFTKYWEATLESEFRATDRMSLRGTYTWSHYYGNFDQDNTTTSLDYVNFISSSNLADGAGRQIWDNKYGDLRTDRRHLLKAYGSYLLPWNATAGAFALYQSGNAWEAWDYRPYSHLTGSTSYSNRYAEPAGSRRADDHYQLDLNYTQNIPIGGDLNLQLIGDVFNVTDNQTGYDLEPYLASPRFGMPRNYIAPQRFQVAVRLQF